jgi:hypothetical protein
MGFSEAARTFGINNAHTVIMKSRAQHWPIPSRVQERVCQLQRHLQRQSEAAQEERNGNDQAVEAAAQSWSERGEMHRQLAFKLANGALAAAARTGGLPIESWRDAHLADQVARKSCGLDHENTAVNINMALVTARLEAVSLSLPKDALPGMPGCESQPPMGSINHLQ